MKKGIQKLSLSRETVLILNDDTKEAVGANPDFTAILSCPCPRERCISQNTSCCV